MDIHSQENLKPLQVLNIAPTSEFESEEELEKQSEFLNGSSDHPILEAAQTTIQCQVCGQGFTSEKSLGNHMRNKHPGLMLQNNQPVRPTRKIPTRSKDLQVSAKHPLPSNLLQPKVLSSLLTCPLCRQVMRSPVILLPCNCQCKFYADCDLCFTRWWISCPQVCPNGHQVYQKLKNKALEHLIGALVEGPNLNNDRIAQAFELMDHVEEWQPTKITNTQIKLFDTQKTVVLRVFYDEKTFSCEVSGTFSIKDLTDLMQTKTSKKGKIFCRDKQLHPLLLVGFVNFYLWRSEEVLSLFYYVNW